MRKQAQMYVWFENLTFLGHSVTSFKFFSNVLLRIHYGSREIVAERRSKIDSLPVSSNSPKLPSCHDGTVCEAQI